MSVRIVAMGDSCLSIVFDETIDPEINARCIAIAASLESRAVFRDVVPTYNAVTVHFDPMRTDRAGLERALRAARRPRTRCWRNRHRQRLRFP